MSRRILDLPSKRGRQILDILYRRGPSTVGEVVAELPDPPSYSAIRAIMNRMSAEGVLSYQVDGPRYVYKPIRARNLERSSAMRHLVETMFDGSIASAVAALLGNAGKSLTQEEVEELQTLIEKAKRDGK